MPRPHVMQKIWPNSSWGIARLRKIVFISGMQTFSMIRNLIYKKLLPECLEEKWLGLHYTSSIKLCMTG